MSQSSRLERWRSGGQFRVEGRRLRLGAVTLGPEEWCWGGAALVLSTGKPHSQDGCLRMQNSGCSESSTSLGSRQSSSRVLCEYLKGEDYCVPPCLARWDFSIGETSWSLPKQGLGNCSVLLIGRHYILTRSSTISCSNMIFKSCEQSFLTRGEIT